MRILPAVTLLLAACLPSGPLLAQQKPTSKATPGAAIPKGATSVEGALKEADDLFKAQNWAEARAAYDQARALQKNPRAATVRLAVEGAVTSSLRLQQWDEALKRAQQYVTQTRGSVEEAIGE